MPEVTNVMLVGVGGQGTILVSTILSKGLVDAGLDVKMSEVHGMAQRGGSVSTQVRWGDVVYSPLIGRGGADVLVSFEAMEALRWLQFLKPSGKLIVNEQKIPSTPIMLGRRDYPEDVIGTLKAKADTLSLDAAGIAEGLGNIRALNVVLFGALVEAMGLDEVEWEAVIASTVKPAFRDLNLRAYVAGRQAVLH